MEADAENLPFDDGSFDVVMSSIGAMFAPHHQSVADELVRVVRPGGTIGLLSWTPEGMIGALFRTMGPFMPPPPPGAQPPPLWGDEAHVQELLGDRVEIRDSRRESLEVTAFRVPSEYGEHFRERYGPTITARANAERDGREGSSMGPRSLQRGMEPRRARRCPLRAGVPDHRRHAQGGVIGSGSGTLSIPRPPAVM